MGLGEAARILRKPGPGEEQRGPARLRAELRHQRLCTCGLTADHCPVWGELLPWLHPNDDLPLAVKFQRLMQAAQVHGEQRGQPVEWLVDSYQDDLELPFAALPELDVRVLFLVRDVRSWVHSRARDGRNKGKAWPAARALLRWVRQNQAFKTSLRRCGKPLFHLGYEELALAPERALGGLCSWLGLEFSPSMLTPGACSGSHILAGNRMRFDPSRSRSIRYDASWLHGPAWPASTALLWPGLAALNRRLVYTNGWLSK
jgi:Sulfotransferase family